MEVPRLFSTSKFNTLPFTRGLSLIKGSLLRTSMGEQRKKERWKKKLRENESMEAFQECRS